MPRAGQPQLRARATAFGPSGRTGSAEGRRPAGAPLSGEPWRSLKPAAANHAGVTASAPAPSAAQGSFPVRSPTSDAVNDSR